MAYFSKCFILTAFLDALLKTGFMLGLQRRPTLDSKTSNLHKLARQNIWYIESITITIQEPIMYRTICIFCSFFALSVRPYSIHI